LNHPKPFADTDFCVKCGLCLPHCPTYNKTLDENESPRGRIALIQAWSSGALKASPKLHQHLDNCLLCRSCENVCPAEVPYGHLVDQFRIAAGKPKKNLRIRLKTWASRQILTNHFINANAAKLLDRYHRSSIQKRLKITHILNRIGLSNLGDGLNDTRPTTTQHRYISTDANTAKKVSLFVGCTGLILDSETIDSAITILNWLGYEVQIPATQVCCGALDLHAGNATAATKLAEQNIAAFDSDIGAILSIASGCGAMLKEYTLRNPSAVNFAGRTQDICDFVVDRACPLPVPPNPLNATVIVHTPCSLKNVMHSEQATLKLIQAIPGATIIPLPETLKCCGAAGTYMLEHPKMANLLRDDVLDCIAATTPDYLVTSNIGCALHIRSGLLQRGLKIEVIHPITLLARQIPSSQ